jgi:hypothetical protein
VTGYNGAAISSLFMGRWRSRNHTGPARPYFEVWIRRGMFQRSYHNDWPGEQFGQIVGRPIDKKVWYADWTPVDDWRALDGVYQVDLDQSFDKNGSTVATIDVDNVAWQDATGGGFWRLPYHTLQRGWYWPWRGWQPANRPGSPDKRNSWYRYLPNAQILVKQGYGPDTALKTFTGLIDTLAASVRPDRITLTCRDFGGVLSDCDLFGWNKDPMMNDPIAFVPPDYKSLLGMGAKGPHSWIVVNDAVEIVKVILRWAGFKEWQIEDSGVGLTASTICSFDKSQSYMDVITALQQQLSYVFFIAEPTNDNDLSIGVPIFRSSSVLVPQRSNPTWLRADQLLTDCKPQHDNKDDRYIIRARGTIPKNPAYGAYLDNPAYGGDEHSDIFKRFTFSYWPPWMPYMSGVIKQVTYDGAGDDNSGILGLTSTQLCMRACVMYALQVALARDTAQIQTPGNPAFGLDTFVYITDRGTGVNSRLYITNRKSTVAIGGDGSSAVSSGYGGGGGSTSNELIWATELGGSLCDNAEIEHIVKDYNLAYTGKQVLSWDAEQAPAIFQETD